MLTMPTPAQASWLLLPPLLLLLTLPATGKWVSLAGLGCLGTPVTPLTIPPPPTLVQAQSPSSASRSMRSPQASARTSWAEVSVCKTAVSTLPMPSRSLAASSVSHAGEGDPGFGERGQEGLCRATQNWTLSFSGVPKGVSEALIMTIALGFSALVLWTFEVRKLLLVAAGRGGED